jgi:pimeloyl-ACP methyl ester carboxylesterase
VVTFGGFTLDPANATLKRGATPIAVTPKAFGVLELLVRRAGQLVTKDEFLDDLWPGVFVGDAVLKVCVREIRQALCDDHHEPTFIETVHKRGYRFIAPVTAAATAGTPAAPLAPAADTEFTPPQTHYARSGDVNIAYQVVGDGPIDLVFVMGWVSHLDYFWAEPSFARFLRRLASFSRLILFDKRGTGLSDRVGELPTLEQRMDDVRAVLDAVGSRRAALLGVSEGGPLCALYATTYPERTRALVMIGTYAKRRWAPDYPWAPTDEQGERFLEEIQRTWGGAVGLEARAPSVAADGAFRDWWSTYLRMGASPGAAVALTRMNAAIDVRDVLPAIRVPTLILHRTDDRLLTIDEGRYVASRIPGATLIELPGEDHLPFVGDQDTMLDAIERFLGHGHDAVDADRVLATIVSLSIDAGGRQPGRTTGLRGAGPRRHRPASRPPAGVHAGADPGRVRRAGAGGPLRRDAGRGRRAGRPRGARRPAHRRVRARRRRDARRRRQPVERPGSARPAGRSARQPHAGRPRRRIGPRVRFPRAEAVRRQRRPLRDFRGPRAGALILTEPLPAAQDPPAPAA